MATNLKPTLMEDSLDDSQVEYNLDMLEDNADESDLLNYKDWNTNDSAHENIQDAQFFDEESIDPNNYKGIYFGEEIDEKSKNHDPVTGAHFIFA